MSVALRLTVLGSGSRGNSTLIECGTTRVLLDAGLSARDLAARLALVGVDPNRIDAILLTHEHADHARGAERFSMRHRTPVIAAHETLAALDRAPLHFAAWQPLVPAQVLDLGALRIEPFPVPHDAAAPVGFVIHAAGLRIGTAVDLGHATTIVRERLRGCDVLLVESNHDERMLQDGPYPWAIKQRVGGRLGHLSNGEAADLLREVAGRDCRAVVLVHLSENNNTALLARNAAAAALAEAGSRRAEMRVALARRPTPAIVL
jgi:phosphoribosyl 1,2-cyclic phosphodiesterase